MATTPTPTSAAVSHVGKIRSNNQDSGYAGTHLFLVADGMGGHAGGDVASAIAAKRVAEADQDYASPEDAEYALQSALIAANSLLAETVFEHSELTGMGTTVSGILRVGDKVAMAHIGDSRIYRFRDGELEQISHRSPGSVSMIVVSISGEASTSPSTRMSTERRGCTAASSIVMRPLSTSRCTNVWSDEICLSSPSRNR